MTDLTEQWKKGELPEGHYYIKNNNKIEIDEYVQWYKDHGIPSDKSFAYFNVTEVLGRVPSYEEWKALNGNMDSVMQTNQALCKKLAKLKDLLTQSRIYVKIETEDYDDRTVSKADKEEAKKLLKQIDEVLNG